MGSSQPQLKAQMLIRAGSILAQPRSLGCPEQISVRIAPELALKGPAEIDSKPFAGEDLWLEFSPTPMEELFISNSIISKPWGSELVLQRSDGAEPGLKLLYLRSRSSLHYHPSKELMILVQGSCYIEFQDGIQLLNSAMLIPFNQLHRIVPDPESILLEIYFGQDLSIRIQDDHGRI